MGSEDRLVAVDTHLDLVEKHLRDLYVVGGGATVDEAALAQLAWREHVRRVGAIVERAHTYLASARQTVSDVADDLRSALGWVDHDLRLLGQVCAMVDKLGGEAARHLAAATGQVAADGGPYEGMLALMLAADSRNLQAARSGAQVAARLAHDMVGDLALIPSPTRRTGREQEHRQPWQFVLDPTGPPR